MNQADLKPLIKELVKEALVKRSLLRESTESFETYVQLDYVAFKRPTASEQEREAYHKRMEKATGWWDGVIEDVRVNVNVDVAYEDNKFDYEFGSEKGVWDPGSGVVPENVKLTAVEDVFLYDREGKPIPRHLLVKRGEEISENVLTYLSQKRLNKEVDKHLKQK